MFEFYDLFDLAKLRAIDFALDPSLDSVWRSRCRQYSITFNTPLHVVMYELDPLFILTALMEEKFNPSIIDEELEEIVDILNTIKDPNYSRMSKQEVEDLVDSVINKEILRSKKKKAPTPENIQAEVKEAESKPKPKSGSMSFGDLEKIESREENNTKGF